MAVRDTNYNYTASTTNCQAPESIQNALGQTTTVQYRYDLGQVASVTDPNGIVVASWGYDSFGRKTLLQRPDGTQSTWNYTSCVAPTYCGDTTFRYNVRQSELDATPSHAAYWLRDQVFDAFDRLRYDSPEQSNGVQTRTDFGYDPLGRLASQSNPYGNGFAAYYTTTSFDVLGRPTSICRPVSSTNSAIQCTTIDHEGETTNQTDARGNRTARLSDGFGQLIQITDPDGVSKTLYAYDPFQNLTLIQDPGGSQTVRTYDLRGHLLTSTDPDRGAWTFESDSLGELLHVRDAKTAAPSWTQQLSYDALGQLITRVEPEGTSTWTWGSVASAHEIGRLKQISGLGETETYSYDGQGRLSDRTTTWAGTSYAIDYVYNTLGKLDTLIYPATPLSANRFQLKYGYAAGYLASLQNYTGNAAGTTFWQLTPGGVNMDPWGNVVDETLGSLPAGRIQSAFDAVTKLISTRDVGTAGSVGNVQSLAFQWDENGNLAQRQDVLQGLTEVFNYDNLDRFWYSTLNGVGNLSLTIDPTGNIQSRTEGGSTYSYSYDPAHRHAVTSVGTSVLSYDPNGNAATRNGYTLTWASYNLPTSIPGPSGTATFQYGPKRDRIQEVSSYTAEGDSGTERTIRIGGIFEVFTEPAQTHYKHYIQAPGGTLITYDLQSVSGAQTSYVAADHLGSSSVLLNAAYAAPLQMSFSAYGYRRASNWSAPLSPAAPDYAEMMKTTRRGYLSQEMLDNVSLVHLNGRIYDPVIGRFLSPDPVLSTIADSQAVNPYSYSGNRPLSRSDPSGLEECGDPANCVTVIDSPPGGGGVFNPQSGGSTGWGPNVPGFRPGPGSHPFPPGHPTAVPSGIQVGPVQTASQTAAGQDSPASTNNPSSDDCQDSATTICVTGKRDVPFTFPFIVYSFPPIPHSLPEQIVVTAKKPEKQKADDSNLCDKAAADRQTADSIMHSKGPESAAAEAASQGSDYFSGFGAVADATDAPEWGGKWGVAPNVSRLLSGATIYYSPTWQNKVYAAADTVIGETAGRLGPAGVAGSIAFNQFGGSKAIVRNYNAGATLDQAVDEQFLCAMFGK
jgi:RHS repeat-associated protein